MRRFNPVLALAVLATVVPEVLFGSTPLDEPGRILATMPIYAGGAILIRELVRRRGGGWPQIALLGAAYGIVEEGLALGSLFNPALFNAGLVGGRLLGVNWTWTEWTLGYHAVWSISIPILLAELLFRDRRTEPWLGRIGLTIAGVIYLAGVVFLALIFRFVIAPDFEPPLVALVMGGVIAVGLAALALVGPGSTARAHPLPDESSSAPGIGVPSPWLVAVTGLVMAAVWFSLLLLPAPIKGGALVVIPMLLALGLLTIVVALVRRWSAAGCGWTDVHRLALMAGPVLVSMTYGLVYITAGAPRAHALHAGACGLAMVGLFQLARRLHTRDSGHDAAPGERSDARRPPARNGSRRTRFSSLPSAPRGSSAWNETSRGAL